jgi:hypothetical protein
MLSKIYAVIHIMQDNPGLFKGISPVRLCLSPDLRKSRVRTRFRNGPAREGPKQLHDSSEGSILDGDMQFKKKLNDFIHFYLCSKSPKKMSFESLTTGRFYEYFDTLGRRVSPGMTTARAWVAEQVDARDIKS